MKDYKCFIDFENGDCAFTVGYYIWEYLEFDTRSKDTFRKLLGVSAQEFDDLLFNRKPFTYKQLLMFSEYTNTDVGTWVNLNLDFGCKCVNYLREINKEK